MKRYLCLFLSAFLVSIASAQEQQSVHGAWTASYENEAGQEITVTSILQDGMLVQTSYNVDLKLFVSTRGGTYTIDDNYFRMTIEFSSTGIPAVGETIEGRFTAHGSQVKFDGDPLTWNWVDSGEESPLASAWFITGRERNGDLRRNEVGARRTMKILSDTRFQWVAYNVETGDFRGTGGGTYTAVDGKYVETIEFFSRDSSRVGASLSFDYEVKEDEWHHSGLSSKGSPIYEIWTPVGKL